MRSDLYCACGGECAADRSLLHAAEHRAGDLRRVERGLARALVCTVAAGSMGGIYVRRRAGARGAGGADAGARDRPGRRVRAAGGGAGDWGARGAGGAGAAAGWQRAAGEGDSAHAICRRGHGDADAARGLARRAARGDLQARARGRHGTDCLLGDAGGDASRRLRYKGSGACRRQELHERMDERGLSRAAAVQPVQSQRYCTRARWT